MQKHQCYRIKPCTVVYLLIMTLTVVTWAIGKTGFSGLTVSLLVLLFALLKGLLIGDYFMGLKGIEGWWRWPVIIWLVLPGSLIAIAFTTAI